VKWCVIVHLVRMTDDDELGVVTTHKSVDFSFKN
jgi:hypothetical protein